jgi:hypothetical protein
MAKDPYRGTTVFVVLILGSALIASVAAFCPIISCPLCQGFGKAEYVPLKALDPCPHCDGRQKVTLIKWFSKKHPLYQSYLQPVER